MPARIILTFATLHQVLAAEKALKAAVYAGFNVRPTPTPAGLGSAICGMSIEILDADQKLAIIEHLKTKSLPPSGVYTID